LSFEGEIMKRFMGCLLCLGLLLSTGCASKTVLGVGKCQIGVRTAAHTWQGPSATHDEATGESRATFGFVSVGVIGKVVETVEAVTFQSQTGETATVDGN